MASSKHPHQMPLTEYIEWARSKIFIPDGRISRQGVAEVRRDLISRVGYLSTTPDEKAVQEAIKLLDPSVDLTTEALAQLETIVTSASETITQEGNEMAETAKSPDVDVERVREMNRIAADREGAEALRRAATGQALDARQAAIVKQYKALEFAHNEQARHEQHSPGGTFSTKRPYAIPRDLFDLERITDSRERLFAVRQLRASWRDNPQSAFNDVKNPEHANHVSAMQRLYEHEAELEPAPEDGEK
jgi:hypothetical protein